MTAKTKTPLDIARAEWEELEWRKDVTGAVWAPLGHVDVVISTELFGLSWMGESTVVIKGNGRSVVHHAPDLPTALRQAKAATHKGLIEAAAKCGPTPDMQEYIERGHRIAKIEARLEEVERRHDEMQSAYLPVQAERDALRAEVERLRGQSVYPVRVVFHGLEAVLMLTIDDGSVYPVVSTWVLDVEAVGDRSEVLLGGTDETWLNARESAEDIRATLQALADGEHRG